MTGTSRFSFFELIEDECTILDQYIYKVNWFINNGDLVKIGDVLGQLNGISNLITISSSTLRSPLSGIIISKCKHNSESIKTLEETACEIEPKTCNHDTVFHNVCADCLETVNIRDPYDTVQAGFISNQEGFYISKDKAFEMENEWTQRMIDKKKLCLILDLDNTLIHASSSNLPNDLPIPLLFLDSQPNCSSYWLYDYDSKKEYPHYILNEDTQAKIIIKKLENSIILGQLNTDIRTIPMYFKLRPGVFEFLNDVYQKFELYLYTMATEEHAITSLRLLDPKRKFFGNRVFTRTECPDGLKSIERILPFSKKMVIIADDSEMVWSYDSACIKVHGYYYFPMLRSFDNSQVSSHYLTRTNAMVQSYSHLHSPSVRNFILQKGLDQPMNIRSTLSLLSTDDYYLKDFSISNNAGTKYNKCEEDFSELQTYQALESDLEFQAPLIPAIKKQYKEFDRQLPYLAEILNTIHHIFFEIRHIGSLHPYPHNNLSVIPDVVRIMNHMRETVFKGCQIKIYPSSFDCLPSDILFTLSEFKNDYNCKPFTHLINLSDSTPYKGLEKIKHVSPMWFEYGIYTWRRPSDFQYEFNRNYGKYFSTWEANQEIIEKNYFDEIAKRIIRNEILAIPSKRLNHNIIGTKTNYDRSILLNNSLNNTEEKIQHVPDKRPFSSKDHMDSDNIEHIAKKIDYLTDANNVDEDQDSNVDSVWGDFWDTF